MTGMDPRGRARAEATFVPDREAWTDTAVSPAQVYDFVTNCDYRLVSIPILESFPTVGASEDIMVLGVATFAIGGWDRDPQYGDAIGNSGYACDDPPLGPPPDPALYVDCGYVWGYLIADAFPPDVLLNRISDTNNPFAPLLIVLTE